MKISARTEKILSKINSKTKLGDLRTISKDIKKDHELAMELWSTGKLLPRLLAVLIMDHTLLSEALLNKFDKDMQVHTFDERNHLMDWLMANQLTKDKKKIALIESWENSHSSLQRRIYWYYQGRLRWMVRIPPGNTTDLLSAIEDSIMKEKPEVQWAMNFTAGWIGVYDENYRSRCIKLGEKTGLYKGEMVSKGCTPSYLPEFIKIEVDKRNN